MKHMVRYQLVLLIFLVSVVVNLDRTNIAIAGTYLADDYHISKIQLGWVFSAFMIGYALFQIPAGWIVGKLGPRLVTTGGLIWWSVLSLTTALVPPAMAHALLALIAVRFVLGLGEAVAYPSANQFVAAWFPSNERGKANAWVQAGAQLGSGTAPPLVAFIIYNYGWHAVFYVSAAVGLLIAVFWFSAARDRPALHARVTPEELAHIQAGLPVQMESRPPPIPWKHVFGSIDVWGTALAYVGFGYGATIFHTWFFIYLKDGRGFDLKSSAVLGIAPFIATTICCLAGGTFSDWLVKRWGHYAGRSLFGAFTLLAGGVFLIWGAHAHDPVAAALLLAGGAGGLYLGQAVYYAVAAEVGGPFTGVVSGIVSMGGQIAGAATASLTPFLAAAYGWETAFTIAGCVTFVCILPWFLVHPDRRLTVPVA